MRVNELGCEHFKATLHNFRATSSICVALCMTLDELVDTQEVFTTKFWHNILLPRWKQLWQLWIVSYGSGKAVIVASDVPVPSCSKERPRSLPPAFPRTVAALRFCVHNDKHHHLSKNHVSCNIYMSKDFPLSLKTWVSEYWRVWNQFIACHSAHASPLECPATCTWTPKLVFHSRLKSRVSRFSSFLYTFWARTHSKGPWPRW